MRSEFASLLKIRGLWSSHQNQSNYLLWPGKCHHHVRLSHSIDQQESNESQKTRGKQKMRKQQKGFSLIELLIVVAIILIIAAIAIPNLMRAKMAANDSSAAASERSIVTAEIAYYSSFPTLGYPAAMVTLGGVNGVACVPSVATACLLDTNLANNGTPAGTGKSGYKFTALGQGAAPSTDFLTTAIPISVTTGSKSYCAVSDGVVRTAAPGVIVIQTYAVCPGLSPLAN
jgi:prepilin-type N-terminal cleavage/methylation domain-containing protein